MRRVLFASVAALFASSALAAPHFSLSGGTVNAKSPVNFVIHRNGKDQSAAVITFTTVAGTARAGTDYAGALSILSFPNGFSSLVVPVATYVNLAHLGTTLQFSGQIKVSGRVTSTASASIVEPAAAPPPPPPPPAAGGSILAPLTPIADNFTTASGICDHSTVELGCGVYTTSVSPDNEGNFRMICGAGQILYDDPIVFPGQAGASHLHQFFGNLGANAISTYSSLRTTGRSTCGDPTSDTPVNRSGYWMPAMLDGVGHVVIPEYVAIYYKREPASGPECTLGNPAFIGTCVGIPTGLRFITGYSMTGGTTDAHPFFYCQSSDLGGAASLSSDLHDTMSAAIPDCPVSSRLTLNIAGPDCWDGVHLDSADHRSHMAHGSYVWTGSTSVYRCDAGHPYHIPQMSIIAFFVVDANFVAGHWKLSCDAMAGTQAGGCFHTDYWEAWSPTVRATWDADCTDGHLQCAGGDLGNGTAIKGMGIKNTSALVPVP